MKKDEKIEELHKEEKKPGKPEAKASKADSKLTELEKKFNELEDQYKRLMADHQNMSKRFNKEREEIHKYASTTTIECLLPALDNFDFAKKSFNADKVNPEEVSKSIEMLKLQILMALKPTGLETIEVKSSFDPVFHEAISKIKDPSKEEGTIIEVVKDGYKIKERVIRPASVVVSTKE